MKYKAEIKTTLQGALDVLCKAKKFEEDAMLMAQKLGLQGEKRRLRYESAKNHNLINFFKCDTYDVFGFTLTVTPAAASLQEATTIRGFFEMYLAKVEDQYDAMHEIANKLVTMNAQYAAAKLYDKCRCLVEDIKYYRRTIMEGNAAGWKPEFIFLHQTTACNIHDEFEEKEKKVGYGY